MFTVATQVSHRFVGSAIVLLGAAIVLLGAGKKLKDYVRPGPYRIGNRSLNRVPVRTQTFKQTNSLAAELDRKSPTILNFGSRRDAELLVVQAVSGGKRQLEWQEAAALQGFPNDYVFGPQTADRRQAQARCQGNLRPA